MSSCDWGFRFEAMKTYHDTEWGIPLHDDRKQFEFLMMEAMQCGLSWDLMIKKREIFRSCFDGFDYDKIAEIDPDRVELPDVIKEQVYINIKYEGYIERQSKQIKHFLKLENKRIPDDIDYDEVESLRIEAREKLKSIRPETLGMASRIQGVSPADCAVLEVYIRRKAETMSF